MHPAQGNEREIRKFPDASPLPAAREPLPIFFSWLHPGQSDQQSDPAFPLIQPDSSSFGLKQLPQPPAYSKIRVVLLLPGIRSSSTGCNMVLGVGSNASFLAQLRKGDASGNYPISRPSARPDASPKPAVNVTNV